MLCHVHIPGTCVNTSSGCGSKLLCISENLVTVTGFMTCDSNMSNIQVVQMLVSLPPHKNAVSLIFTLNQSILVTIISV